MSLSCRGGKENRAYSPDSTVTLAYCCGREVLNPSHDMTAIALVFLPLLTRDQEGNLVGCLAERWEHSSDYREWTYYLRTDIHWHDGVPVTAHDIAFTIEVMRAFYDPDYGAGAFESVTVHNDSMVTIRSGHGRRIYQEWMVFYPKHLLEGLDATRLSEWDFWERPVGNGPYRFVRLDPETMMEFEANPDFYLGKPQIERVILKFSNNKGITDLLAGQVDGIPNFPEGGFLKIEADPRFRIYQKVFGEGAWVIYWKNDHPLFQNPQVRRALTMAIDRRTIMKVLNIGDELPIIDGPLTPDQFHRGGLPEPIPFDPTRAQILLDNAGWRDRDGDGILEREGQKFRFTMLFRAISSESQPGNETAAVLVQSQLQKVGVHMDLQSLDPSVVSQRLGSGDFEAALTWLRFYETPWLQMWRIGEGPPLGYRNSRVVELIELASQTWVPEEEDRYYSELMAIFQRDVPVTIMYPFVMFSVAHRRLQGLSSPWRTDPVVHMEELWIEETK
jgi:peptide/nickel transport system substrate-binding protein